MATKIHGGFAENSPFNINILKEEILK